jgi:hypothetical protein
VPNETTPMLIALASFSAIATASMSLAGFFCRKPHGLIRYPLYFLGSVLLTSMLCMAIIMFGTGDFPVLWRFALAAGMMTLMVVLFLLPYLILSATCAFYRERFRALVGMPTAEDLQQPTPPPLPQDIPADVYKKVEDEVTRL